ncbi:MAG TPA: class I adenylate-forming enzyme family protein [Steroidobacteraceae bacterium]|jgi:long-chain acyl-CoA synthetase|nr:class I adenylate-forming enzyme family protein [Steroidobacteraceae bacterium]
MLMHQVLIEGAQRTPDKLALHWVDRDVGLTYAQAVARMEDMAGALASLGVGRGDRVSVFAHNGMDYLLTLFGAWRIGAIAALVNVQFAAELADYLADHTPSVVVYTHDMVEPVQRAARAVGTVRHLLCMDGAQPGALSLPELMNAQLPAPADPADETAIAHLAYTSGTTGKPKGACLAHEPTMRAARCIAERLRLSAADHSFGPTALSSSYQLVANLLPPLSRGASVHVMGKWTPKSGWAALDSTAATVLVANPTVLQQVLTESQVQGRVPGRLRAGLSGGGPVPPSLKSAWREELKLPLVESFGQSELGGFMALGFPELVRDDALLGRVGPALPDKEVRIVDANRSPLPPGHIGEIELRGGFMVGYWGRPEKTQEAIGSGWLRTGDLGLMDAEGFITMRGRRSELIETDGVLWFPRDVEEAFCAIDGVAQAAVVGVADAALGQRPHAFITLQPQRSHSAQWLKSAIAGKVRYDLAALQVSVVEQLPMTPTGKIAKGELAARLASAS